MSVGSWGRCPHSCCLFGFVSWWYCMYRSSSCSSAILLSYDQTTIPKIWHILTRVLRDAKRLRGTLSKSQLIRALIGHEIPGQALRGQPHSTTHDKTDSCFVFPRNLLSLWSAWLSKNRRHKLRMTMDDLDTFGAFSTECWRTMPCFWPPRGMSARCFLIRWGSEASVSQRSNVQSK